MKSKVILHIIFHFLCLVFVFNSCIEPYKLDLRQGDLQSQLVVECQLTNEPGPFKVFLTTSGPVDKLYSQIPCKGAEVVISDNNGNNYQLTDNQDGWYETEDKNLKGISGRSYTLKITDPNGNMFESAPELMTDVPEIDSVYFEEVIRTRFENDLIYEDNFLNILLDTKDPAGKTSYWFWKFEETWEVRILPYVHVMHGAAGSPDIYYNDEYVTIDPVKEVCWVTRPSSSLIIQSTENNEKDDIKKFVIQSLGPGEDKLHIRYSILVKQYSLNREMYNYWLQLKKENENAGGIYSTIPGPVYGNITSVEGNKKVLGYFSASSVTRKRIFINPADHNISTVNLYGNCVYLTDPNTFIYFRWIYFTTILNSDIKLWVYDDDFCTDCRAYGTNVKPDFW